MDLEADTVVLTFLIIYFQSILLTGRYRMSVVIKSNCNQDEKIPLNVNKPERVSK